MEVGINTVFPNLFASHIEWLKTNHFSTEENNLIISFDDAYQSIYNIAYPLMKKNHFTGLVFPITSYIGKTNKWDVNFFINKKNHMNKQELVSLYKEKWEIGSHGHLHKSYRFLSKKEIEYDMSISKEILENLLNSEVTSFAPPFGYYNEHVLSICDKLGYTKMYIQQPLVVPRKNNQLNLEIVLRRSVYLIDSTFSIKHKSRNSYIELLKENFIHSCSIATTVVKKSFDI